MRISLFVIPLFLAFALPTASQPQIPTPLITGVEPAAGRAGDILTVQGVNLGQEHVAALFLTDGTIDIKLAMIEQTATAIRFKIPPEAKPGRLALMILTKDKDPRLLEQPVKITVDPETESAALRLAMRLESYV